MTKFIFLIVFVLLGCNSNKVENQKGKYYIHIDGSDTSRFRLVIHENRFYGEVVHTKWGGAPVVGKINGNIIGDTLIGDNLYTPYRWKEKKRAPIVLLRQGDNYVEGGGPMIEFMGILTYPENTITFDNPKRKYVPVNQIEKL